MADLIDRQALRRKAFYNTQPVWGYLVSLADVLDAPSVDAVEVVRCKDCKHYGWEQEPCHGKTIRFCKLHKHKGILFVGPDTFCSYGERREEDAVD